MAFTEMYRNTGTRFSERVGSDAFNLEYKGGCPERSIREDLISYLGEYRFEISRYEYSLFYKKDQDTDRISIFAPDQERMLEKSRRSIADRRLRGQPTHREESETLGIISLEQQLSSAAIGDTIFWASPPGPREEGYGDYGFIYQGKIGEEAIIMTALRVENPTIAQYNRAMTILTGVQFDLVDADEFLRSPYVVNNTISDADVERVLKNEFSYAPNDQKQKEFELAIKILSPLIDRTVFAIQNGSRKEKKDAFYALENIALDLRNRHIDAFAYEDASRYLSYSNLDKIISTRSFEPPIVKGSCGSTALRSSNMLFSGDSAIRDILLSDKYGSREFICPMCHQINIRPENELLEKCQHCGSTEVSCEESKDGYQKAA